jgi:molybdopterin-guanine dinucleotide biosynthesis protein
MVSFRHVNDAAPFAAIRKGFDGVDLVLVEGFNTEPGARIELRRADGSGKEREARTGAPFAVVELEPSNGHPSYKPEDIGPLAELIVREVLQ